MKVFIERENKTVESSAQTGSALLDELGINETTVLIVKNDEVVIPQTELSETDSIKILSVISGG
ncbi:MAG: MoaD/ThiS family protein [Candidatus Woesearchaeota archaeon]